jgi:glyoxylase-like metal-dependent hydrolase (beta-lactamase superfamily II)
VNLEDTHLDVLLKAQKAQGMTDRDLVKLAEISVPDLNNLRAGRREPVAIEKIARTLNLRPEAVVDLANSHWHAPAAALPPHVLQFTTPFDDMSVNHYLIWDPKTLKAVAFDAGTNADPLFAALERHKLTLTHIFLTHSHGDHILELDRIREKTKAKAYAPDAEPIEGCEPVPNAKKFKLGSLAITAHTVPGHSVGGTVYEIRGLASPLAVVGDVIFAGSVGGIRSRYRPALEAIRAGVLSLSPETILLPGHGPITTVAHELSHNPFFP